MVIPFLAGIEEDNSIYMEDGAKVHLGHAKKVRADAGLQGFKSWPPSSPDLNPIEKVWRWMKGRITQMEPFPTTIEALKEVVQDLWDEMDPAAYIKEIEKMPEKCIEVIQQKGGQTRY